MGKKHADRDDTSVSEDQSAPAEAPPPPAEPSPLERFQDTIGRVVAADAKAPPPTIGRIVIYASAGEKGVAGEPHAAIITGVDAATVALRVFTRTSEHLVAAAEQGTTPGTWAWPARV